MSRYAARSYFYAANQMVPFPVTRHEIQALVRHRQLKIAIKALWVTFLVQPTVRKLRRLASSCVTAVYWLIASPFYEFIVDRPWALYLYYLAKGDTISALVTKAGYAGWGPLGKGADDE